MIFIMHIQIRHTKKFYRKNGEHIIVCCSRHIMIISSVFLIEQKKEALEFVEEYVEHVKGIKLLHIREFDRRYRFSPLKHFHKELGI